MDVLSSDRDSREISEAIKCSIFLRKKTGDIAFLFFGKRIEKKLLEHHVEISQVIKFMKLVNVLVYKLEGLIYIIFEEIDVGASKNPCIDDFYHFVLNS